MWDRRWLLCFGLALGAVVVTPSPGSAGVLDASWTAPTTNTDGSPLIDLASYRVYYGASAPPCPGGTFVQAPSSTSTPSASQTVTSRLTGLTTGTLCNISLTAVDSAGLESACSPAPAPSRSSISLSPPPPQSISATSTSIASSIRSSPSRTRAAAPSRARPPSRPPSASSPGVPSPSLGLARPRP